MSKIDTALFVYQPEADWEGADKCWREASGSRVTILTYPEADVIEPDDEFQVIIPCETEGEWPHTVYRKELSEFREEES